MSGPGRARRLAVVAGPDPGHAFPAIALAVALHEAGHAVTVCSGDRWADAGRRCGPSFVSLPRLGPDPRDDDLGFRLWGRGQQIAPLLVDLLAPWRPEVVVADAITVPGWFAADLIGVPRVELVATALQEPSIGLPPPGSGLLPGRGVLGRGRDAWLRRLARPAQRAGALQCRAARRALGLADDGPPVLRLVATLPALELPRPDWPTRTHLVGPLEWEPDDGLLAMPPGPGPVVLVADSSASGARQGGLLDLAADVLPSAGIRVVGTRFGGAAVERPGVAIGVGRHSALLNQVDAVVLPGGHGLLSKALARGKPVVVIPGPGDQRDNAVRVCALGAGVMIEPRRLSAETLATAVRRVVDEPSYAAAAARVAASARGLGPARAVDLVESVFAREFGAPAHHL
ncbi:MAG TPA: nucleotide disphospho-sugar-binding domain-containing protein [Mycobacteriales bacterium]|nr:nucleotide disphospho-sugar-binding domain-containing protein [Mycobacteriales bacterium]